MLLFNGIRDLPTEDGDQTLLDIPNTVKLPGRPQLIFKVQRKLQRVSTVRDGHPLPSQWEAIPVVDLVESWTSGAAGEVKRSIHWRGRSRRNSHGHPNRALHLLAN